MKSYNIVVALLPGMLALLWGCDLGEIQRPDPQNLKLEYRYGFGNAVDTFNGSLTKDLVMDGSITVPFWLTAAEQDSVAAKLQEADFFALPDTVFARPGIRVEPNPGVQWIRVSVNGRTKSIRWYIPPDNQQIVPLANAIQNIIESTPEYTSLPAARGGHL